MAIEKLVCSNCKGKLRWNPDSRIFICENCGTSFQTDNEFTYRMVDEARIEEARLDFEKKKLDIAESDKALRLFGLFYMHLAFAVAFIVFCYKKNILVASAIGASWIAAYIKFHKKRKN